ncbi:MAG: alkaline phosphatase family protein [Armatimonadota bacterium]
MNRRTLLQLAGAAAGTALLGRHAAAQRIGPARAKHVVLISLDGFAADYLDDPRLPLPNLRRLAEEGARADRLTVITPSVTWPDHTTLVTGVTPARHGVLANGLIETGTGPTPYAINPRRSKEELCRVPTLYDVAKVAGLRTAEVNWPVTRGAATLDFSIPDHPEPLTHSTPQLLQELRALKILGEGEDALNRVGSVTRDQIWTDAAVHLIRKHRPNVLLLHLLNTDGTQHAHGPNTNEAYTALALADRQVGDVLRAVGESGLKDETAVFVVADHGFIRVTRQIQPNVRLREAGLIRVGEGGRLEYAAQSLSEGGVALVYVPDRLLRPELVEKTRAALNGLEGVERIVDPSGYDELGLPQPSRSPQAPDFVLAAKDGFAFGNATTGAEVVSQERATGSHGYLHTNPRMDGICVAAGAGIRRGARVERARNLDVAPTLAHLLGLDLGPVEGKVIRDFVG